MKTRTKKEILSELGPSWSAGLKWSVRVWMRSSIEVLLDIRESLDMLHDQIRQARGDLADIKKLRLTANERRARNRDYMS